MRVSGYGQSEIGLALYAVAQRGRRKGAQRTTATIHTLSDTTGSGSAASSSERFSDGDEDEAGCWILSVLGTSWIFSGGESAEERPFSSSTVAVLAAAAGGEASSRGGGSCTTSSGVPLPWVVGAVSTSRSASTMVLVGFRTALTLTLLCFVLGRGGQHRNDRRAKLSWRRRGRRRTRQKGEDETLDSSCCTWKGGNKRVINAFLQQRGGRKKWYADELNYSNQRGEEVVSRCEQPE